MKKRTGVRQRASEPQLLERMLDTPEIAQIVPRLQPELLLRVIQHTGLEDCGELVALATPEQLVRLFNLDLWRSAEAGRDEQFDPARFGVWLQVLAGAGVHTAAQKVAGMDVGLVTAGLAHHARVFDRAAVASYTTTDGVEVPAMLTPDHEFVREVGSVHGRRPAYGILAGDRQRPDGPRVR